jgi:hypothetical protein
MMKEHTRKLSSMPATEEPKQDDFPEVDHATEPLPAAATMPEPEGDDVPDWVVIPDNMKIPRGKRLTFVRFRANWTDSPFKGERQCVIWTLTDGEEKLANDRCAGSPTRAPAEYTKQMIRVVDGVLVDWSKTRGPGSVDEFWKEIGPKCRSMLMRMYTQLHLPSDEDINDFFQHCVAVRTAN